MMEAVSTTAACNELEDWEKLLSLALQVPLGSCRQPRQKISCQKPDKKYVTIQALRIRISRTFYV